MDESVGWYGRLQEKWAQERREKERREQEKIAQRQREEQAAAQQKEDRKKMLAVDLILGNVPVEEANRVKGIVAARFPTERFSPERHWYVLQQLRDAVGVPSTDSKPTWIADIERRK